MLGYISASGRGAADRLLADLARDLGAQGVALSGVVQLNRETRPDRHCDMDLQVLGHDHIVRISQDLGPNARGCRLDAQGLVAAVALVEADLARAPELVIINKFGKSEIEGRGFREIFGQAIAAGIPVLTAVNSGNLAGFLSFAGGLAEEVVAEPAALRQWTAVKLSSAREFRALTPDRIACQSEQG